MTNLKYLIGLIFFVLILLSITYPQNHEPIISQYQIELNELTHRIDSLTTVIEEMDYNWAACANKLVICIEQNAYQRYRIDTYKLKLK